MNLVFVAVDTLRSDHLSCYGYPKATSPNIDALAKRGVLFEQFFSVGNCTHPGFTAMLTGRFPESSGIVSHWTQVDLADDVPMMAEHFARAGFRTCAVDNLFHGWARYGFREYPWFRRAYETYVYPEPVAFDIPADACVDLACRWLEQDATAPFLLFLHLWDPHGPYNTAPKEFYRFYDGDDPCDSRLNAMPPVVRRNMERSYGMSVTDPSYVEAAYDAEIAYTDHCVGRLLEKLDGLGMADDTVICLTSDHGEILTPPRQAVGRPWCFGHVGLNQENLTVPLAIAGGSVAAGQRVSERSQLVDIVPTLIELFDLEPQPELDGRSLAPALRGEPIAGRDAVFFSENTYQKQRAVLCGPWKYMRMEDAYQAMAPSALHNLDDDPDEYLNLADFLPEGVAELDDRLSAHIASVTAGEPDPMADQPITRVIEPTATS